MNIALAAAGDDHALLALRNHCIAHSVATFDVRGACMRRRLVAGSWLAAMAFALGGCAGAPTSPCAPGQRAMRSELLYFGTAMPHGTVSSEEWRGFVDEVVTPRFPDGLTAWPASGQWKSADGTAVREASWVISVVHGPDARSETALAEIVDAYKTRFHQESVLRVTSDACVTF